MKAKFTSVIVTAALGGAASAQLTGIKVSAGYGWSGGIKDSGGISRTLSGPELTVSFPFQRLPLVDLTAEYDVLFGGVGNTSIEGTIHRFMLVARIGVPGSKVSAWAGLGYGRAQGHAGDFASVSATVTQVGVSIPLGSKAPGFAPSIDIAGSFASRTAVSGFMIGLGLKF